VRWGKEAFGLPIHDNWWQTETGGIMIANFAALPIRPGSMGLPLPGIEAAIVRRLDDGSVAVVDAPDTEGELALKRGWPSMFRGYLGEDERYRKCFAGDWYLTGDLARRDADGYFWFVGRADDVIKSSGHLIGPFEVESAFMEHPAVAEAGVIGKPDPVAGEIVKAFVALKPGFEASRRCERELLGHARKRSARPWRRRRSLRAVAAEDPQRQDHAPPAEGPRARPAGRRHVHDGDRCAGRRTSAPASRDAARTPREVPAMTPDPPRAARCCARCCASAASRRNAPSSTAPQKIRGFLHLYIGEEAMRRRHDAALEPDDAIVATYREHGHALVRGVPMPAPSWPRCSASRKAAPRPRRLDAPLRRGAASTAATPSSAAGCRWRPASRWPTRCRAPARDGLLLRRRRRGRGRLPREHEPRALWKLPVLFSARTTSTRWARRSNARNRDRPRAPRRQLRMAAASVDGMDIAAVYDAVKRAVAAMRVRPRPRFLELRTYRFRAHSMFDAELYRDKAEVAEWRSAARSRR
jgi:hypothetical protein